MKLPRELDYSGVQHRKKNRLKRQICRTENCNLAALHIAFQYHHDDNLAGEKSFMYGTSKANQLSIIIIYMYVHACSIQSSVVIGYKHCSLTVVNRRVVVRTMEKN